MHKSRRRTVPCGQANDSIMKHQARTPMHASTPKQTSAVHCGGQQVSSDASLGRLSLSSIENGTPTILGQSNCNMLRSTQSKSRQIGPLSVNWGQNNNNKSGRLNSMSPLLDSNDLVCSPTLVGKQKRLFGETGDDLNRGEQTYDDKEEDNEDEKDEDEMNEPEEEEMSSSTIRGDVNGSDGAQQKQINSTESQIQCSDCEKTIAMTELGVHFWQRHTRHESSSGRAEGDEPKERDLWRCTPYKCQLCDFRCSENSQFNAHYTSNHRFPYCPVCLRTFPKAFSGITQVELISDIENHVRWHQLVGDDYACNRCQLQFCKASQLEIHLKLDHADDQPIDDRLNHVLSSDDDDEMHDLVIDDEQMQSSESGANLGNDDANQQQHNQVVDANLAELDNNQQNQEEPSPVGYSNYFYTEPWECQLCPYRTSCKKFKLRHKLVHTPKFVLPVTKVVLAPNFQQQPGPPIRLVSTSAVTKRRSKEAAEAVALSKPLAICTTCGIQANSIEELAFHLAKRANKGHIGFIE